MGLRRRDRGFGEIGMDNRAGGCGGSKVWVIIVLKLRGSRTC